MGTFYNKERIDMLKQEYTPGMRVRLVRMDDTQAPPIGTEGTVNGVDDIGQILVSWDNGSSLNLIIDEDEFDIIGENK